MKSFKEYLTESKKVYEFKVKIAGKCPTDCSKQIKAALAPYNVTSVSAGKRTPIQEHQADFPEHKNVEMTIFEIATDYPVTSPQVRDLLANVLGKPLSTVKVKTEAEEFEHAINHENDSSSGESLLTKKELEDVPGGQDMVGEKHTMSLLKELNKTKKAGEQYTGVNDEILASGAPKHGKETPSKQVKVKTKIQNIFTKQVKVPTAKGVL